MGSRTWNDTALLLLRFSGFFLAIMHGWGKFSSLATGQGDGVVAMVAGLGFPIPFVFAWAAALAEFAGGLLVAVGFQTRIAASFAAFAMFVAAFAQHKALLQFGAWIGVVAVDPEVLRAAGNPERALLFFFVMAALALMGAGAYSVEGWLGKRRR